jgi:hypothetical protein
MWQVIERELLKYTIEDRISEHLILNIVEDGNTIKYHLEVATEAGRTYVKNDTKAYARIVSQFCRKIKDSLEEELNELSNAAQTLREVAVMQYQSDTDVSLQEGFIQDRIEFLNTASERFIEATSHHEELISLINKARRKIVDYQIQKKYDMDASLESIVFAKYFAEQAENAYRHMSACIISEENRGIPAHIIREYPIVQKEGQCCICYDDFENRKVVQVPCASKHAYHVDCIIQWLRGNTTCPLCRNELLYTIKRV